MGFNRIIPIKHPYGVAHLVNQQIFQIWNHVPFIWKMQGYDKEMKFHQEKINNLADKGIEELMKLREKSETCIKDDIEPKSKSTKRFLDYIAENKQFTKTELRDEVIMFMIAGTDTTATTLIFLCNLLGMYPNVQQKVYEEVIAVLGKTRSPEIKDLPHLEYTERVIKETLRLFPSAPIFLREITEDVNMGDFCVPKGASVYFGLTFIHRNPKYWPDPLKFDPDRFLPEEVAKRHPCTFLPFSFGPRACIGRVYAIMTVKVIIATIIRKFTMHSGYKNIEEIKLKANLVLRFKDKLPKATFSRRE